MPPHADPADTDPADTDPADADPADTDPANTDPANTDPDPLGGTFVHWNLAGWSMHRGAPLVAEVLARDVRAQDPLPLAVTVNEACSGQYEVLAATLAEVGFSAAAAWSIPSFGEPGCASYGNAVFWRGGDGGVERYVYPDELQVDGSRTREKRTLIRARSATLPFAVGTTHPPPSLKAASAQVRDAARWLAERQDDRPTVLAGDLNLTPWSSALDVLYRTHQEADRWPRRLARPTHRGFRKLDYVFVPRDRMRVAAPISIAFRCRLSDHARLCVDVIGAVGSPSLVRPGQPAVTRAADSTG